MLTVRLLGGVEVHQDAVRLPPFPTRRSAHLFAFLVLHRHRSWPRYLLADKLWPRRSESAARRCLRTELWRLRRLIEGPGAAAAHIVAGRETLRFRSTGLELDVAELERAAAATAAGGALGAEEVAALERAAGLYRGELLEGCDDEWCLPLRNRLRDAWLAVLEHLMDHHAACGQWRRAVAVGSRLAAAEPLHERARHKLLQCRWMAGDRAGALRDYSAFSRLLARELGIEPIAETRQLERRIRSDEWTPEPRALPAPLTGPDSPIAQPGSRQLVQTTLTELQGNLQRAVRSVQRTIQILAPRR